MTVRDLLTAVHALPRDAELLGFEAGCEDYCEREVDDYLGLPSTPSLSSTRRAPDSLDRWIRSQPTAVHAVWQDAVLAAQVGCTVQVVRSCRAECRRGE